jgi:hypothetical protein
MSTGAPASDDSDMEPQPASDPEQYAHCTLCEFTGGENYKFQEILNFVADHCHEVHIDGLCTQVKTSLETEFQMTLSHAEIKNHFLHHQCDQKIVLNNILRDLVPLVGVARSNCCVLTQENTTIVDPKTMGMYLDTVKQVMGIYKHLDAGRASMGRR